MSIEYFCARFSYIKIPKPRKYPCIQTNLENQHECFTRNSRYPETICNLSQSCLKNSPDGNSSYSDEFLYTRRWYRLLIVSRCTFLQSFPPFIELKTRLARLIKTRKTSEKRLWNIHSKRSSDYRQCRLFCESFPGTRLSKIRESWITNERDVPSPLCRN